jgi:hypothetical protein
MVEKSDEMTAMIDVSNWIQRLTLVSLMAFTRFIHHVQTLLVPTSHCLEFILVYWWLTNRDDIGCDWRGRLWSVSQRLA